MSEFKKIDLDDDVIVILMSTSSSHPCLKNAIKTLQKHEFSYWVVGLNEKWQGWRHRMSKYKQAAEWVSKNMRGKKIMVLMDAYDALSVRKQNDEKTQRNFVQDFESYHSPIVFSLEIYCFCNCLPIKKWWDYQGIDVEVPDQGKKKYVNGGLTAGRSDAIQKMYQWMLDRKEIQDDQKGLAMYINAHPDQVHADLYQKLFNNKPEKEKWSRKDAAYFVHFPGMKTHLESVKSYNEVVSNKLRNEGMEATCETDMNQIAYGCVFGLIALILILVILLWAFGLFSRTVNSRKSNIDWEKQLKSIDFLDL